ncbi:MAG: NADH-quinone oxidoreductase subunit J, partial [Candidatus Tectomicrobia bacterium]|nr:NADH-quinone oxidoreductase subunit J [Candidatus Tectomicrobia bacterium]
MPAILFYILSSIMLASALLVIFQTHPVYSVVFAIISFISLAGLFLTLGAEFIAAAQIIVYTGAIMVLFLFVVMLLNLRRGDIEEKGGSWLKTAGSIGALVLLGLLGGALSGRIPLGPRGPFSQEVLRQAGNTQAIGRALFTDFLFPF